MVLAKQNIPYILNKGINDKVSDKLRQGTLKTADNIRLQTSGIIEKRFGVQALGATDSSGSTLSNFEKLGNLNNELLAYANGSIYSYASSIASWFLKGSRDAVTVRRDDIIRNSYEQSVPSIATKLGTTVIAWEDGRGGVRASVIDDSSGHAFISDTSLDATATRPKCINIGNALVVFYVDASNVLKMVEVSAVNPSSFSSPITVGTCNATGFYDVVSRTDSQAIVVHSTAAGTNLRYAYILSDSLRVGSSIDGVPNAQTQSALNPTSALNAFVSEDGNIWAFYYNSSNGVYYQGVTANALSSNLAETQISASTTNDVYGGFAIYEKTSNNFTIVYDRDASSVNDYRLVKAVVTSAGAITTAEAVLVRSLSIVSKQFNSDYFIAGYNSTNELQDTYFVLDTNGQVISRFSATVAGGHLNKAGMNVAVVQDADSNWVTVNQVKTKFIKDEGQFFTKNGIDKATLTFSTQGVLFQQLGENTHFTGGIISDYDGQSVVEHNFNYYPEDIQIAETTGGSLTTTGTYSYIVHYQWEDSKGQVHRSTTSIPVSITLTGSNNQVNLTIPTLRVTDKSNVTIEVYGTTNNGTIYYRLTSFSSPTFNDTTVDSITFNVTDADSVIQDNELLYTTGNVLDNSAPPAAQAITSFQNRLWLGALEEPNKVWYSKEKVDGLAVEFSEALQLPIDPRGGRITALAALDDKLVVFKETSLFVITGVGPTAVGTGGSYNVQLITSDVGAIDANTVVSTEQGLMFKSRKGIYLLNRGLQASYIGAPVESLNDLAMTASVLIEDANEVRFLHSNGQAAVYNYYFGQWYTFSNYEARHAINLNSTFYKIKESDRVVENEVADYYGDRLAPIIMTIETGWFSFGGINGYKRVYELQTVGDYQSNHSASVILSYDFVDSEVERFDWTPGTNKKYGEESPYGSETYGGGSANNSWFYRFRPQRQKCTAIRVKIQDRYPDSNLDKGFQLNGISFLVGVKAGLRKPRTANRSI